jgi:predicted NUDIX family phosphoesterase
MANGKVQSHGVGTSSIERRNAEDPPVAAINDDSTDVGYVHFGVVHVMPVDSEDVAGRRSGIVAPEFVPIAEAVKGAAEYESWSRFCPENIDALLAKAAAAGITVPERVGS